MMRAVLLISLAPAAAQSVCCLANIAQCMACQAGVTIDQFCTGYPNTVGCRHGKFKEFMGNAKQPSYFNKEHAYDKMKEFELHAKELRDLSKRPQSRDTADDFDPDDVKRSFELLDTFSKETKEKMQNKTISSQHFKSMNSLTTKDLLKRARDKISGDDNKKAFDKSVFNHTHRTRKNIAYEAMKGKPDKHEITWDEDGDYMRVLRDKREDIVDIFIGEANKPRVKFPQTIQEKLPKRLDVVVHMPKADESNWGGKQLRSRVVSITVLNETNGEEVQLNNLNDFILIRIPDPQPGDCKWWDNTLGVWSGVGCTRNADQNNEAECKCTHLTDFAIVGEDVVTPAPTPGQATVNQVVVEELTEDDSLSSTATAGIAVGGVMVVGATLTIANT